ncbi:PREDICTED: uncharacterized protein LOC109218886, partial [Nicotiana attenuata]|uniref:uncharacterized protein LOC109218886 n=1 Tax=Nicotiana attenuata TaxID=49451 RepID=UPI0009054B2D
MVHTVQGPWIALGDFNSIIDTNDRIGGVPVQDVETREFRKFQLDSGLVELKSVGRRYTWTKSHVFSKIDWAFVNSDWMQSLPHIEAIIMDPGCSNHSPIAINFEDAPDRGHRPFRFLNCLANHPSFLQLVKETWMMQDHNQSMYNVWARLKAIKQAMKQLNKKELCGIEHKITINRSQLNELQSRMRDPNQTTDQFEQEKSLQIQLEKWSLIEEVIARQKYRIQWFKAENASTKFFYG